MTFNFNFKCDKCEGFKQRNLIALNTFFNENIINIIASFERCRKCEEMLGLENTYNKEEFNNYSTGKKQLHCILHHFDSKYRRLTNLKQKQQYFKDIINEYTLYSNGCKKLMIKFINDTKHIQLIEAYKAYWFLNYDVDVIKCFWYEEDEEFHHHGVRQYSTYKSLLRTILEIYFTNKTACHCNQAYFNSEEICNYLKCVFE